MNGKEKDDYKALPDTPLSKGSSQTSKQKGTQKTKKKFLSAQRKASNQQKKPRARIILQFLQTTFSPTTILDIAGGGANGQGTSLAFEAMKAGLQLTVVDPRPLRRRASRCKKKSLPETWNSDLKKIADPVFCTLQCPRDQPFEWPVRRKQALELIKKTGQAQQQLPSFSATPQSGPTIDLINNQNGPQIDSPSSQSAVEQVIELVEKMDRLLSRRAHELLWKVRARCPDSPFARLPESVFVLILVFAGIAALSTDKRASKTLDYDRKDSNLSDSSRVQQLNNDEDSADQNQPSTKVQVMHIPKQILKLFQDDFFADPACKHVWDQSDVIVGVHPDEPTERIVKLALKTGKAFAVVPCCVFAKSFPNRLFQGEKVTTYTQFLDYLQSLHPQIQRSTLDFGGQNTVLWKPADSSPDLKK